MFFGGEGQIGVLVGPGFEDAARLRATTGGRRQVRDPAGDVTRRAARCRGGSAVAAHENASWAQCGETSAIERRLRTGGPYVVEGVTGDDRIAGRQRRRQERSLDEGDP